MWSSNIHNQQLLLTGPEKSRARTQLVALDKSVSKAQWEHRVTLFLDSERYLLRSQRLRKLSSLAILGPALTLVFSLYVDPSLSEGSLLFLSVLLASGLLSFPVLAVASHVNQVHRDAISRRFYLNNHDLELSDNDITLIDRASYKDVARVIFADRHVGHSSI